jgi:hypothetical protein
MKRGLTTNVNVMFVVMVCTLNLHLVHMITIEPYSHNAQAQAPSVTNQTSSQSTSQPEIYAREKNCSSTRDDCNCKSNNLICQSTDPSTSTGNPK